MKASLKELLADILGVDFRYPVGSYYETSDASFDPNIAWGGVWVLESGGRVHISSGANEANTTDYWGSYPAGTNNFPIGERGGEPTHTLNVNEMPSHVHVMPMRQGGTNAYFEPYPSWTGFSEAVSQNTYTGQTGGSQAHNNLQPYVVVNRWHRTA